MTCSSARGGCGGQTAGRALCAHEALRPRSPHKHIDFFSVPVVSIRSSPNVWNMMNGFQVSKLYNTIKVKLNPSDVSSKHILAVTGEDVSSSSEHSTHTPDTTTYRVTTGRRMKSWQQADADTEEITCQNRNDSFEKDVVIRT